MWKPYILEKNYVIFCEFHLPTHWSRTGMDHVSFSVHTNVKDQTPGVKVKPSTQVTLTWVLNTALVSFSMVCEDTFNWAQVFTENVEIHMPTTRFWRALWILNSLITSDYPPKSHLWTVFHWIYESTFSYIKMIVFHTKKKTRI